MLGGLSTIDIKLGSSAACLPRRLVCEMHRLQGTLFEYNDENCMFLRPVEVKLWRTREKVLSRERIFVNGKDLIINHQQRQVNCSNDIMFKF
jgi:hypothetical protein